MRVTILVPVYGVERYIAECAESLFSQTYKDIEYVFCDDCTPDRSIEILCETLGRFPERRNSVRIIRNDQNSGLGFSRKRLTEAMQTDYFMIVDSDDVLPCDAVMKLTEAMKKNDTDIVEGAYCEFADGKKSEAILPFHGTREAYQKKILCQNVISGRVWGKLYKAKVLKDVENLFIGGIDFSEDFCAMARLCAVESIATIDDVVCYYRVDNISSYTKNIKEKDIMSYFRANRVVLDFYHLRGHLPLSLEVGILNAYRECRRSNVSMTKADDIMEYVPEHFSAQLLLGMFRNKAIPLSITDALYRVVRRMVS